MLSFSPEMISSGPRSGFLVSTFVAGHLSDSHASPLQPTAAASMRSPCFADLVSQPFASEPLKRDAQELTKGTLAGQA